MKPVITIDIDDVLFPTMPLLTRELKRPDGTPVSADEVYTYEFHEVWGHGRAEMVEHVYRLLDQPNMDEKPLAGAVEVLARLRRVYCIVLLTSRNAERHANVTRRWLEHHFQDGFDEVLFSGNHHDGKGFTDKSAYCRKVGSVLHIDDLPLHISDCKAAGIHCLLFGDYAWNREDVAGVSRCANWAEVRRYIEESQLSQ